MQLRVPHGGEVAAGGGSAYMSDGGEVIIPDATPDQVNGALTLLFDGAIEYVGLHDGGTWIQTADVPGGYVVERSLDGGEVVGQPDPLSVTGVTAAFQTFLAGRVDAGLTWAEPEPPRPKKGWFRR